MLHLVLAAALLTRPRVHDVLKLPGCEIQAAAYTRRAGEELFAGVRVKGPLPTDGLWSLKIISVSNMYGPKGVITQSMANQSDSSPYGLETRGFSPIKSDRPIAFIRMTGELVHYQSVEETTAFPEVTLTTATTTTPKPGRPAFRLWNLPENTPFSAKTITGLTLERTQLNGFGYSGPGYDDMALIPLKVDEKTLNSGIEERLKAYGEKSVDRVDAYTSSGFESHLYSATPPKNMQLFGLTGKDFAQQLQFNLKIIRRIVDTRYKFNFVVPVQLNKDFDEQHTGQPNPDRFVIWPGSL